MSHSNAALAACATMTVAKNPAETRRSRTALSRHRLDRGIGDAEDANRPAETLEVHLREGFGPECRRQVALHALRYQDLPARGLGAQSCREVGDVADRT